MLVNDWCSTLRSGSAVFVLGALPIRRLLTPATAASIPKSGWGAHQRVQPNPPESSRPSHALAPLFAVTCTAWVVQG